METTHRVFVGDARDMRAVADDSVHLVVTSPPYPMIEMWDGVFADLDPTIDDLLAAGDGDAAHRAMHALLDDVWAEVSRVLVPGGIACVNVGDATRSIGDGFRRFDNHSRVTRAFEDLGLRSLPSILWRKPTNSAAKFMGSGMLPPNAYPTLEHEHVLVFRNGSTREFPPGDDRRYASAYFWEERNRWFSDVWTDLRGRRQADAGGDRERSGAYPLEVPYRLVNMFSVYGDTVLDPFWGTGTTTRAAMTAGRDSVGYELDPGFLPAFDDRVDDVAEDSRRIVADRLAAHESFVAGEEAAHDHVAEAYDVPVRSAQETDIRFYVVDHVEVDVDRMEASGDDAEPVAEDTATVDDDVVGVADEPEMPDDDGARPALAYRLSYEAY